MVPMLTARTVWNRHRTTPTGRSGGPILRVMVTHWYDTGSNIQLYMEPQQPPPGRYLGTVELTHSELELLERIVDDESTLDVQEPGRTLPGRTGGAVG